MMFNSPDNARPKINSPSPVTAVPDELIAEVLSLLKVKSLLRLKCVSKSWNKLISDPFFVKIHFHKSSLNTDLTLFSAHHTGLLKHNGMVGCYCLHFAFNLDL
ncbi:hypothetical protein KIW84_010421 [Lathyrus oleraceus]|uniref:F-box domain-containing protein n=1 Tax=Pisum sativum TaxID=3888 RepID=A0A9D4YM73_PEA|nr:hypothetical protein KIW84_010421 [Pisum sativum]